MIHIFRNIKTIDFPSTEAIEYLQHDAECASYLDMLVSDCVGEVLVNTGYHTVDIPDNLKESISCLQKQTLWYNGGCVFFRQTTDFGDFYGWNSM